MSRFLRVAVAASLLGLSAVPGRAILDLQTSALPEARFELLVVETDNCIYCGLFRRDVAPTYTASIRARSVPMRFIDLNAPDIDALSLSAPIESVPTVLVVEQGREVGRIAGYVGPEIFFHSLNTLLPEESP
ncbi:MAG: thioredoxin family protein [Hyphomicrobium sp.]|jgi:thioredoxin-related protein|nr:thioredoxin family protein [Hyphomicrobium sp.]